MTHCLASPVSKVEKLADLATTPLAIRILPGGVHTPALERRDIASRETLLRRVCSEFNEMPGLRLTLAQAQRLFALPTDICERVLSTLVATGLFVRRPDGSFARRGIAA